MDPKKKKQYIIYGSIIGGAVLILIILIILSMTVWSGGSGSDTGSDGSQQVGDDGATDGSGDSGTTGDSGSGDTGTTGGETSLTGISASMDGLVGLYRLDESSGSDNFEDSSPEGNDGSCPDGSCPSAGEPGRIDQAALFDDAEDHIELDASSLTADEGTVLMWASAKGYDEEPNYFFGHTTEPAFENRIQLYAQKGGELSIGLGDEHEVETGLVDLPTEVWYHVALTWSNGDYAVYYNGEEVASGSYSGLDSIAGMADIGNNGDSESRDEAFVGKLDEVAVFDRALSASEILTIFENAGGESSTDGGTGSQDDNTVEMTSSGFEPDELSIAVGETVTWIWAGEERWPASDNHPTHTLYPGSDNDLCGTDQEDEIFDACGSVEEGESYSFTFDEEGNWDYHDHAQPGEGGTIKVG